VSNVYYLYDSIFGKILIESNGKAITRIKAGESYKPRGENKADALTEKAAGQLAEYFAGKRKRFDVPLNPLGTDFQCSVWKALMEIPYGETRSYKQIAQAVASPNSCRAVGMANNTNPIWIIIPCHRVIGSNGTLTGYGGGLEMKQRLLDIEQKVKI